MSNYKQLFRSSKNRVFGGVCGGIGEFIGIDPVIIRLIWLGLSFLFGTGIVIYLLSWLIIPSMKGNKSETKTETEVNETKVDETKVEEETK